MDNQIFNFNKNIYDIDKELINKIEIIFMKYFMNIEEMSNNNLSFDDCISFIMVIGESFDILNDKSKWNEIGYKCMCSIREKIRDSESIQSLSLFGGYTEIGFITYMLYKNTGYYNKFLFSINDIILNNVDRIILHCKSNMDNLNYLHYDSIVGLSGIAYYLLMFKEYKNTSEVIQNILKYFIMLTNYKNINGNNIPGWYIKSENQITDDEKTIFPNGNLNFGVAHGIGGPLIVLTKSYEEGIIVDGQVDAIKVIIKEYMDCAYFNSQGVAYWPTQLPLENYIMKINEDKIRPKRASWCYGNVGITRALYLAGKALNDKLTIDFAFKNMEKISELEIKDYILETPILCHGYSGLLTILSLMYKETGNIKMLLGVKKVLQSLVNCYDDKFKFGFMDVETISVNGKERIYKSQNNNFIDGAAGIILSIISLFKDNTDFEKHILLK